MPPITVTFSDNVLERMERITADNASLKAEAELAARSVMLMRELWDMRSTGGIIELSYYGLSTGRRDTPTTTDDSAIA